MFVVEFEVVGWDCVDGKVVGGDEEVELIVVVLVEELGGEGVMIVEFWCGLVIDVDEVFFVVVVVELVGFEVWDVEIEVVVVVDVFLVDVFVEGLVIEFDVFGDVVKDVVVVVEEL